MKIIAAIASLFSWQLARQLLESVSEKCKRAALLFDASEFWKELSGIQFIEITTVVSVLINMYKIAIHIFFK